MLLEGGGEGPLHPWPTPRHFAVRGDVALPAVTAAKRRSAETTRRQSRFTVNVRKTPRHAFQRLTKSAIETLFACGQGVESIRRHSIAVQIHGEGGPDDNSRTSFG